MALATLTIQIVVILLYTETDKEAARAYARSTYIQVYRFDARTK